MDNQPTPVNPNTAPEVPAATTAPNVLPAPQPEQAPKVEAAPGGPAAAPPAATSAPILTASDVAAAIASVGTPNAAAPVVPLPAGAGDVDLIEPEWVNKAEAEVRAHAGDPYGEEAAVEDLQQDYLKKRYNYNVADPDADSSKPEGK